MNLVALCTTTSVDAYDGPGEAAGGAQSWKVGDVEQRVGGGLQPEQARAGDGGPDTHGVGQVNAVNGPAPLLLAVGQQLADPEIAVPRSNDAAAGRQEVEHGRDYGHAGGEGHGVTALDLAHRPLTPPRSAWRRCVSMSGWPPRYPALP